MNIRALAICCIITIFFGVYSLSVNRDIWKSVDFAVTVKLQEKIDTSSHMRLADLAGNIIEGSSFIANPEFSLISVITLSCFYCFDFRKRKFRISGLMIPLLFGLLVFIEIYVKTVIHHPSPPFFMIKNPSSIFPKYYINDQFSYPSGHVARATFLSLSLYSLVLLYTDFLKKRKNQLIGLILVSTYIGIVSLSRIYLGHHWFSDIVGGLLLGSSMWLMGYNGLVLLTRTRSSHIIPKR